MEIAEERALAVLRIEDIAQDQSLRRIESMSREVWMSSQFVLKIGTERNMESLEREARLLKALPRDLLAPHVMSEGSNSDMYWVFLEKIAGEKLSAMWPLLTREGKRRSVTAISRILKRIHSCEMEPFLHYPPDEMGSIELNKIGSNLDSISDMPGVDRGVAREAGATIQETMPSLKSVACKPIHGDLHFANLLLANHDIAGVLDFEYSCVAPPDLDLDIILRYCAHPYLYDSSAKDPRDFEQVPCWLKEDYEALFVSPDIFRRMLFYNVSISVAMLANQPKGTPMWKTFYKDLVQTMSGKGYLNKWEDLFGS